MLAELRHEGKGRVGQLKRERGEKKRDNGVTPPADSVDVEPMEDELVHAWDKKLSVYLGFQ